MINQDLLNFVIKADAYKTLAYNIEKGINSQNISGLKKSAKSLFLATLRTNLKLPLLVLTKEIDEAWKIYYDLIAFLNEEQHILILPPIEVFENIKLPLPLDLKTLRISALKKLMEGKDKILVTTYSSFFTGVPDFNESLSSVINIKQNDDYNLLNLVETLIKNGYRMETYVEKKGEISVRGGILDIYSLTEDYPVRIEFDGNEIVSIRYFDLLTQRAETNIQKILILPADESLFKYCRLKDYMSKDTLLYVDEPYDLKEQKENYQEETEKFKYVIYNSVLSSNLPSEFHVKDLPYFKGNIKLLIKEFNKLKEKGYEIILFFNNKGEQQRFLEILKDNKCHLELKFNIGEISEGFYLDDAKLSVITDNEIFGRYKNVRRRQRKISESIRGDSFKDILDITSGEYIVHVNYGIGKFLGLKSIEVESIKNDFIALEYASGDKLYVPVIDIGRIHKYAGFETTPALSKLGTSSWEKIKEKVKEDIRKMAMDLLELYSVREVTDGFKFSSDTLWQKEFEDEFIYEETKDQIKAIADIKKDMESGKPIDRLICGDVGYGKTEVAIRASFKCVTDGKQVAVLAPTTILAEQHYKTFSERMADYPVNIAMLSRFTSKKEQEQLIYKLKAGSIDIIIGTHRLLQKDICFNNLGLLIIDDEQKFGVTQKERIKQIKKIVYCLSLSATPIPRTLYLSLSGIREISNINTPPEGRIPIETYITSYDDRLIKGAILKELARGGQIYYVYNKVKTIDKIAEKIKKLIPQAKVEIAHGQMPSCHLEKVMMDFYKGNYNCLVCTTIIESGLDVPTANTIIIEDADELGLSQLYQLRGRVGRSKLQAYAYLTYPKNKILTEVSRKRLDAIEECNELSMGFNIAMKDLEIRGAGNILGKEQHGQIAKVGFELYCNLLRESILEIKSAEKPAEKEIQETEINVRVNAFIPDMYIPDSFLKLNVYKDMMAVSNYEDIEKIRVELKDRFGVIPSEVENLFKVLEIKILARELNVQSISENNSKINIKFRDGKEKNLPLEINTDKLKVLKEYFQNM